MKRVMIGGIGNVLQGDDGVGPYAVRVLEAQYDFGAEVSVEDLGTPGLNLIAHLLGAEALILVDSVNNGKSPGTVSLYRREEILRHHAAMRVDPHSPALTESLMIVGTAGDSLQELLLVGITGQDFEAATEMSEAVRQAVPGALAEVLRELDRLGVSHHKKAQPSVPAIWWQSPQK